MKKLSREDAKSYYYHIYILSSITTIIKSSSNAYKDIERKFGNLHNLIDYKGATLLHYSVERRKLSTTRWLLQYGLNVDAQTKDGTTPLMLALQVDYGQYDKTPFELRPKCNNEEMVSILLQANPRIDLADNLGETIFEKLSYEMIKESTIPGGLLMKLLDKCKTVEEAGLKLFTARCPIYIAVLAKKSKIIKFYLRRGENVNRNDNPKGVTALHMAVYYQDSKIVKLLLYHKAKINAKDSFGYAPINYMREPIHCRAEQLKVLKILLGRGANLTNQIQLQEPMQIYSVFKYCSKDAIRLVLESQINLHAKDGQGNTLLHYLAENKNPGILQLVLQDLHILGVDIQNKNKYTALNFAASSGHVDAVKLLLDHGANINNRNIYGYTPLYGAWRRSHRECIQLLLQRGAEIQIEIFEALMLWEHYDSIQPILAHQAILEVTGKLIENDVSKKINSILRFRNSFDIYKRQLEEFKEILVFGPVTMFMLLTQVNVCEDKLLVCLRSNQQVVLNLNHVDHKNDMYYYQKVQHHVFAMIRKVQLRVRAAIPMREILKFDWESHIKIIDHVVSYLSDQDLINLAQLAVDREK